MYDGVRQQLTIAFVAKPEPDPDSRTRGNIAGGSLTDVADRRYSDR